ncbi:SGNH/GDSL hydrolase family protein [Crossiella sp. NPDC003009]
MRKLLWRTTIALTALLLLGAGALAYAAFLRAPVNSPAAYLENPRHPAQVLVAAGSSSTKATLSADWPAALRTRLGPATEVINAGANGDTTAVTLLIGGNDARNQVPLETFRANLTQILTRLKPAKTAIFSLPPQGEDLTSQANQSLTAYNQTIKDLAAAHHATYLPLNEELTTILRTHPPSSAQDFTFLDTLGIAIQRYLLGRTWNEISTANGLHLLTDNLHLNDRAGEVVTALVTTWLSTPDPAR